MFVELGKVSKEQMKQSKNVMYEENKQMVNFYTGGWQTGLNKRETQ